jgi:hypothetical protein
VHVNRTIRQLREDGLIRLSKGHVVQLLDWERLTEVAEFDPTYLRVANLGGRFDQIGRQHMEPQSMKSSPSARQ